MATGNIPVDLFYASYPSDCTYELNSSVIIEAVSCDFFVFFSEFFVFFSEDEQNNEKRPNSP